MLTRPIASIALGLIVLCVPAATAAARAQPASHDAPLAAAACTKHKVGTQRICLKVKQRCQASLQIDYLKAHFSCHAGRLRHATLTDQRQGEPLLLDKRGRITPHEALEAFDATLANLPGVTAPPGAVGTLTDPTSVLAAVAVQHARLTPAQRAVLQRITHLPATAVPRLPANARVPATAARRATSVAGWVAIVGEARQRIMAHGYVFPHVISLSFPKSSTEPASGKRVLGFAFPSWLDPDPATHGDKCLISITPLGNAKSLFDQRKLAAHEVFHCAQFEHYSSITDLTNSPQWVIEGGAEWAGDNIALEWNGHDEVDKFWAQWLYLPERDLGGRLYSAVGFFSLLKQNGVDVWAHMHDIIKAATSGDGFAYDSAVSGLPSSLYENWGAGLVRNAALGARWDLEGAGIYSGKSPVNITTLKPGSVVTYPTAPRAAFAVGLKLAADFVIVAPTAAHGLMSTPSGESNLATTKFCTVDGGCTCPDGTDIGTQQVPPGTVIYLGWQNGLVGASATTLAKECDKEGHGGSGGASRGVMLYQKSVNGGTAPIAYFKSAACRKGSTFTAVAKTGGYVLTVKIPGFGGFQMYTIHYQDPTGPGFVVTGLNGPFSNVYFPGGRPPAAGGAIQFSSDGTRIGVGFIDAFNADDSDDILLAGTMACVYPPK